MRPSRAHSNFEIKQQTATMAELSTHLSEPCDLQGASRCTGFNLSRVTSGNMRSLIVSQMNTNTIRQSDKKCSVRESGESSGTPQARTVEVPSNTKTLEHAMRLRSKVRMPSAIGVWSMHTLSSQKLGGSRWFSPIVYISVHHMSKTVRKTERSTPYTERQNHPTKCVEHQGASVKTSIPLRLRGV